MEKKKNPENNNSGENYSPPQNQSTTGEKSSLSGDGYEVADVFENAEPWDPIETKIVIWSFVAAVVFLAIFGFLVNLFILD